MQCKVVGYEKLLFLMISAIVYIQLLVYYSYKPVDMTSLMYEIFSCEKFMIYYLLINPPVAAGLKGHYPLVSSSGQGLISGYNFSEVHPERELGALLQDFVGAGPPRHARVSARRQRDEVRDPQAAALARPLLPARGDGGGGGRLQARQLLRPHLPQPLPADRPGPHLPGRHRAAQGR